MRSRAVRTNIDKRLIATFPINHVTGKIFVLGSGERFYRWSRFLLTMLQTYVVRRLILNDSALSRRWTRRSPRNQGGMTIGTCLIQFFSLTMKFARVINRWFNRQQKADRFSPLHWFVNVSGKDLTVAQISNVKKRVVALQITHLLSIILSQEILALCRHQSVERHVLVKINLFHAKLLRNPRSEISFN